MWYKVTYEKKDKFNANAKPIRIVERVELMLALDKAIEEIEKQAYSRKWKVVGVSEV